MDSRSSTPTQRRRRSPSPLRTSQAMKYAPAQLSAPTARAQEASYDKMLRRLRQDASQRQQRINALRAEYTQLAAEVELLRKRAQSLQITTDKIPTPALDASASPTETSPPVSLPSVSSLGYSKR